jgi:hypothetical protein
MIFLESLARPLLVLHAVLGAATVAVTTHLAIWSRRWAGGSAHHARGVRWFSGVAVALYVAQFGLGNLLYPVYKIRVRAEYLELGSAVAADQEARDQARSLVRARAGLPPEAAFIARPTHARAARLFDVKEHLAALGLPLILVALLVARTWDPVAHPARGPRALLLFTTAGAALVAWTAALAGLIVSAIRAVP